MLDNLSNRRLQTQTIKGPGHAHKLAQLRTVSWFVVPEGHEKLN
jgi:hypothetical protein